MACLEGRVCKDYLLLNPEKASVFDLVRILCFSSNSLKELDFIDIQEPDNLSGFHRRWLIFVSIFLQKLLIMMNNPMAATGAKLEKWLNLLSSNDGLLSLLLNFLTGKVKRAPEPSSQDYSSTIGCIDMRMKLDENIKNTDPRYKPQLSLMAAKLSYENEARIQNVVQNVWEMEYLGFFDCWDVYLEKSSTQAMMFKDTTSVSNTYIVVAFRGTSPFNAEDWRTNVDFSWYNLYGAGNVHGGFMKALGLQNNSGWPKEISMGPSEKRYAYYDIRQKLRQLLGENENATFIVTGHSLGGALAILFAAVLMFHEEEELLRRLDGVYTYGQPRVGDRKFGEYMMTRMFKYNVKYFRYVYCNDMVCRLPYDDNTLMFKHFGRCLYFNSLYKGEVCKEEPNKNYFSPLWTIPMLLNAVWELVRSFLLPWVKGKDYDENWFCRFFRITAILCPGVSNHSPQDYGNLTRIGTLQFQTSDKDDS